MAPILLPFGAHILFLVWPEPGNMIGSYFLEYVTLHKGKIDACPVELEETRECGCCQSHLGTQIVGQNGRSHCKGVKICDNLKLTP